MIGEDLHVQQRMQRRRRRRRRRRKKKKRRRRRRKRKCDIKDQMNCQEKGVGMGAKYVPTRKYPH